MRRLEDLCSGLASGSDVIVIEPLRLSGDPLPHEFN